MHDVVNNWFYPVIIPTKQRELSMLNVIPDAKNSFHAVLKCLCNDAIEII